MGSAYLTGREQQALHQELAFRCCRWMEPSVNRDKASTELRARAARFREHARTFRGDDSAAKMLDSAADLEAAAAKVEREGGTSDAASDSRQRRGHRVVDQRLAHAAAISTARAIAAARGHAASTAHAASPRR
jgi:hypothetical protein